MSPSESSDSSITSPFTLVPFVESSSFILIFPPLNKSIQCGDDTAGSDKYTSDFGSPPIRFLPSYSLKSSPSGLLENETSQPISFLPELSEIGLSWSEEIIIVLFDDFWPDESGLIILVESFPFPEYESNVSVKPAIFLFIFDCNWGEGQYGHFSKPESYTWPFGQTLLFGTEIGFPQAVQNLLSGGL